MKSKLIRIAAIFGAVAVILGALAAHQLKSMLNPNALDAFDKGVRYQIYHVLFILVLALYSKPNHEKIIKQICTFAIVGICLFSFSIYLLSTKSITHLKLSFLGPVTPLGGLCFIISWILLALNAQKLCKD